MLCSCTWQPSPRLARISALLDSIPAEAVDSLAAIDRAALSEADARFYDYMRVKADDKSYIAHSTDTLIIGVLNYCASHRRPAYYPEALYYAGRVYNDLGDYPTALRYYQDALAELPADKHQLRGNILSQTGRLLNTLRLYNEAIPYLEEVLDIDRRLNDSINFVYDLQLLGGIYMRADSLDRAEDIFRKALDKSLSISPELTAETKLDISAIKFEKGEIDSALCYSRGIKEHLDSLTYNYFLSYSAEIYFKAGIMDTAFLYAEELRTNDYPNYKLDAYRLLLKPQLRTYIVPDSIDLYYSRYLAKLEEEYTGHGEDFAVYQRSMHNYEVHDRLREEAEKSKKTLLYILVASIFTILICLIVILYLKGRNKNNIIRLQIALDRIKELNERNGTDSQKDNSSDIFPTEYDLRQRIESEFRAISDDSVIEKRNSFLIHTQSYQELQTLISQNKSIKDQDPLWQLMEEDLLKCSPHFKLHLQILSLGKLSPLDYHTALLIRYGIQPTQMTFLVNRSKSTISTRRERLLKRVFSENRDIKELDTLIYLL